MHCLSHQHGDFSENVHRVQLKDLLLLLCVLILRWTAVEFYCWKKRSKKRKIYKYFLISVHLHQNVVEFKFLWLQAKEFAASSVTCQKERETDRQTDKQRKKTKKKEQTELIYQQKAYCSTKVPFQITVSYYHDMQYPPSKWCYITHTNMWLSDFTASFCDFCRLKICRHQSSLPISVTSVDQRCVAVRVHYQILWPL